MSEIHFFSMSKSVYQEAGGGFPLNYAMVETPYGQAFLAESCGRVVFLSLMQDEKQGLKEFTALWNQAKPSHQPEKCKKLADDIFADNSIEEGKTLTYQEIANQIGQPEKVIEVAKAVGDNPIAHLIPCHRAVLSQDSLGDYRWGIESKRSFLQAEGVDLEAATNIA